METPVGRFCWIDLAASDAQVAKVFYERMFGWRSSEQAANGGHFIRLRLDGHDVGSLYPLRRAELERGASSHWMPYVRVADADDAARRAAALGGRIVVRPFEVSGVARIAVIADAVGALLGLWQALDAGADAGVGTQGGP
ncbi:MAG TPA: VOC family protein [Usitatibacter sp.]|nr:VOC family protein [Usitatibacter sp.]